MNAQSSQPGFTDYVGMVWKRRSTALFAAAAFACVTFIAFNFVPRRYRATCVFERQGNLIASKTGKLPESFANLKPLLVHHTTGAEAVRQALVDLGYTDDLQRDAAGDLTPDAAAQFNRQIASVRRNLLFSWIFQGRGRDRMSLRLTSGDPVLAYTLPNQLVRNYIEATGERLVTQLSSSQAYLDEQIANADAEAAELARQRYDFIKGHPDMLPENPQFMIQQVERLTAERDDLRRQREALTHKLDVLKDREINGACATVPNPQYVAAAQAVKTMEAELAALRTTMTERHPKVVRLQREIAASRTRALAMPRRIAADEAVAAPTTDNAVTMMRIEDARADLERLTDQEQRKTAALARVTKAQANFLPVAREYQKIAGRLDQIEKEKQMWQKSLTTVQQALAAEKSGTRTQLSIISPAAPVYRPSWPALWHVFVLAIGGGLAFGVVLTILMARLGRSFSSSEEARGELGLPVLGVVGPILTPAARRIRAIRRYVLAPTLVALLLAVTTLAATGVVMSTRYPGRYAQIIEHMAPTTRAVWQGMQSLLGLS